MIIFHESDILILYLPALTLNAHTSPPFNRSRASLFAALQLIQPDGKDEASTKKATELSS